MRLRAVVLALVVVPVAVACRQPSLTLIPDAELPPDVYASAPPTPTEPIPAEAPVYLVRKGRLDPVVRSLPRTAPSVAEATLQTLLQARVIPGYQTAIPSATRLNGVHVEPDVRVATVDLSAEFEQGGTERSLAMRVAQVVYTLTQDDRVFGVLFSIEGRPAAVTTPEGVPLNRPVTRQDYEALTKRPR